MQTRHAIRFASGMILPSREIMDKKYEFSFQFILSAIYSLLAEGLENDAYLVGKVVKMGESIGYSRREIEAIIALGQLGVLALWEYETGGSDEN